jgi:DNA/RNA-binding domain of Phe-tRNA-synthetase-like protein
MGGMSATNGAMKGIVLQHEVERRDLALGGLWLRATTVKTPPGLSDALGALIAERQADLPPDLEQRRKECRDILRNGRYKPVGRGKPASEYLLRSAREGTFPRIRGLVDAINLVSLETLMPISLWDVDRAPDRTLVFRLGEPGQRYVFNPAGHEMDLQDLVCGGTVSDGVWTPSVNPVKDSMATKTNEETTEVAAVIYAPVAAISDGTLDMACRNLLRRLESCSAPGAEGAYGILRTGERKALPGTTRPAHSTQDQGSGIFEDDRGRRER